MKKKALIILAVGFVAILFAQALSIHAQEQESQLLLIYDAYVHPSKVADFVKATRAEVALYEKYKFPYAWSTYSTFDNHFYFIIYVDNFAAIDKVFEAFNKIEQEAGKEYQEMIDMFAGTFQFVQPQIFLLDYGLSLISEGATDDPDARNIFWDIHYVYGGMEAEYEKNLKKIQDLFISKKATQDWYCYKAVIGEETPVYYFATASKSPVEFYTENRKMWDALGEEIGPYYEKSIKLLRKRDEKRGWYREGLSYTPPEK
jgi:hypothetical protein